MSTHSLADTIEEQTWLEPVADTLQRPVNAAVDGAGTAGKRVEDLLNGVWLGHPLHPVLTDIPLGAWTVSSVLDAVEAATGRSDLSPGADAAVEIGLVGAVGAAVTGLAQFHFLGDKKQRRVGVAHALLNVTATSLFVASLVLRKQGNRPAARALGWLGYAIGGTSAYLGGHMVFNQRLGVDHAPREDELPEGWHVVLPQTELRDGQMKQVRAGDVDVMVARIDGRLHALANACAHLGGPLAEGTLEDGCVVCPWHGSRFRLEDGAVVDGPSNYPQPRFEARIREGWIEVRAVTE